MNLFEKKEEKKTGKAIVHRVRAWRVKIAFIALDHILYIHMYFIYVRRWCASRKRYMCDRNSRGLTAFRGRVIIARASVCYLFLFFLYVFAGEFMCEWWWIWTKKNIFFLKIKWVYMQFYQYHVTVRVLFARCVLHHTRSVAKYLNTTEVGL